MHLQVSAAQVSSSPCIVLLSSSSYPVSLSQLSALGYEYPQTGLECLVGKAEKMHFCRERSLVLELFLRPGYTLESPRDFERYLCKGLPLDLTLIRKGIILFQSSSGAES